MIRRILICLGCGLVGVAAVVWFARSDRGAPKFTVQTAVVSKGVVTRRIILAGTLQAVRTVDIGSQVSGAIHDIDVDFDSVVHKGQRLARIDPVPFDAELANAMGSLRQAQANVESLKVTLEFDRIELKRAQQLLDAQLMQQDSYDSAKATFDEAVAAVDSAEAQVMQAQGQLDSANTDLAHTTITSPLDGIVINRAVDIGQTVAASFQAPVLFTLATDLQKMQVQANVDEADMGSVKEGQIVSFDVEAYPDETFQGTISQVRLQPVSQTTPSTSTTATTTQSTAAVSSGGSATASSTSGVQYTAMIDVANPDYKLRPGMTATVFINGLEHANADSDPESGAALSPSLDLLKAVGEPPPPDPRASASGDQKELQEVWRYDGKIFTPVAVSLGMSDAQWAEQHSGPLQPGDVLAINTSFGGPAQQVIDGPVERVLE